MSLIQFQNIGHELFLRGLIASHSGNMSIRLGERLLITRRGSRLGCLSENEAQRKQDQQEKRSVAFRLHLTMNLALL